MLEVDRNRAIFQESELMSKVPSISEVRPALVKVQAPAAIVYLLAVKFVLLWGPVSAMRPITVVEIVGTNAARISTTVIGILVT